MDELSKQLQARYDAVAFDCMPDRRSHPDRLAVEAMINGITPAPVNDCRVLEIGCALGNNLLAMSEQMPKSQFLGIDLSPRQIEVASGVAKELALPNISFRCLDLMEFPQDAGKFDFIIAHGVHSWVPPEVAKKLLSMCATHLAPSGVAYVSHNVYPGWRTQDVIRDMMQFSALGCTSPKDSLTKGREIVEFVAQNTPDVAHYRSMLQFFRDIIRREHDSYVFHEYIELVNYPHYFREFAADMEAAGLAYLGDAESASDAWYWIPPPLRESIGKRAKNRIEREQYMDFLTNRGFRCSVMALANAPRSGDPANRFRKLHVSGALPDAPAGTGPGGLPAFEFGFKQKIKVASPRTIAVLRHLRRIWPASAPYDELLKVMATQSPDPPAAHVRELNDLLETCYALRMLELYPRSSDYIAVQPGLKPKATKYARWRALHQMNMTSLRHQTVSLTEQLREIVPLADGTKTREDIAEALLQRSPNSLPAAMAGKDRREIEMMVASTLDQMASSCLLLKEDER